MRIEPENASLSSNPALEPAESSPGANAPSSAMDPAANDDRAQPTDDHVIVQLSPEAMEILEEGAGWSGMPDVAPETDLDDGETTFADPSAIFGDNSEESTSVEKSEVKLITPTSMTSDERSQLAHLRMTDAAVRSLQFSRIAMAGSLAHGQSTQFTSGPDGRLYATSGEVDVDTNPGSTPRESLARASTLRRFSAAGGTPISTPAVQENVSAQAAQIEFAARSEMTADQMTRMVETVEHDAEVNRRDTGAAVEAANWTAPPEFTAQGIVDSDNAAPTGGTELEGAAAVTEIEESAQTSDEPGKQESNLRVLFEDPQTGDQSRGQLNIVA
jgi:hypothetical protein